MKKHWLLALIAVLVLSLSFSLVACNNGGTTGSETPNGGNETPNGGNETPDGGNETPDGGNETPDGGNETPEDPDNNTPVASGNDGVFNYVLNDKGTGYILSGAVAGVTEGIIPATFKNLPINDIDAKAFKDNALASFSLDGNTNFTVKSGALYSKNGKTLLAYPGAKTATTFKLENSATAIGAYAFAGNDTLTEIDLNKVTDIGEGAFSGCSLLASFKASARPTSCGKDAFTGTAYYVDEENWIDGILYLAYGNYQNKTRYLLIEAKDTVSGEISLHNETWCIADYAFYENESITTINCHESLYSIGAYSFAKCSAMTNFKFSAYRPADISTKFIGEGAFYSCTSLITFTIPFEVKTINALTFSNCTSMHYMLMKPDANAIAPNALTGTPIEYMFYDLLSTETTQVDPIKGPVPELQLYVDQEHFYDETGKVNDGRHNYWRYVEGIPTLWK